MFQVAGVLLILSFVSFAVGGSLPLVGEKGNPRFFNLPEPEYLANVVSNAKVWRWANAFMGAAVVILLAGLTMLATILEGANELILSRLGLVLFLPAAVLWVIFSAWRAVIAVEAGQAAAGTGTAPAYYGPLTKWASVLYFTYAVMGFLALAAYGGSWLLTGLAPAWTGWVTVVFSLAVLVLLLVQGDTLPAFHYVPPLVLGIILLLSS